MKHHKYTNTKDDPELAHRAARAPQWDLPIGLGRIIRYCTGDLLGGSFSDYIIIVSFSKSGKGREYLPLALFHIAIIAIAVVTGFWWVGALWYLSLVTSFMMFFRLRTVLEHLGTGGTHRLHLNWWQRHLMPKLQSPPLVESVTDGISEMRMCRQPIMLPFPARGRSYLANVG